MRKAASFDGDPAARIAGEAVEIRVQHMTQSGKKAARIWKSERGERQARNENKQARNRRE